MNRDASGYRIEDRIIVIESQKGDKELLSRLLSLKTHPSALDVTLEDRCVPVENALTLDGPRLCCWAVAAGGGAHQAHCKADNSEGTPRRF
ncbi:hypothetical protein NQZ68_019075 [Dissostichus eleginoides]|nr:hypothetical protein NQZ68_019075 [Dissostichus eleginoides]